MCMQPDFCFLSNLLILSSISYQHIALVCHSLWNWCLSLPLVLSCPPPCRRVSPSLGLYFIFFYPLRLFSSKVVCIYSFNHSLCSAEIWMPICNIPELLYIAALQSISNCCGFNIISSYLNLNALSSQLTHILNSSKVPLSLIPVSPKNSTGFSSVVSLSSVQFSSVQSLSHVRLSATPWAAACQA